jgi:hypothetical protein
MSLSRFSIAVLVAMFVNLAGIHASAAAVLRVPADHPTIQAAINAAANGDTVQVAPGYYFENINFLGKAIRVTSEQGPQVTVIDGNQAGSVVTFASGETAQAVLNGFTLQNGLPTAAAGYRGGGVRIQSSSPTITANLIRNNSAGDAGGGISSSFGSPLIQGNTISNNRQIPGWSGGVGGGGVSITGGSSVQLIGNTIVGNSWSSASGGGVSLFAAGSPAIKNNYIVNNSAYSQGGGISMFNQSDALIAQNIIANNSAGSGGGVYWLVPSGARGPLLVNNTITGNSSIKGSAIFADGFDGQTVLLNNILTAHADHVAVYCGDFDSSLPIFRFNDAISDSGIAYAGTCSDQTGFNGNFSLNPLFRDAAAGDYHLKPGSPAIDAATFHSEAQVDADGVARPVDGDGNGVVAYDLGAYEAPAVDSTPPVTTAALTPIPNSAGWIVVDVKVTLTGADSGSGVKTVRYALSGAQTSPQVNAANPASLTISSEGSTNVDYSSIDFADNAEIWKSLRVNVDKSKPVISGMPAAGCTLTAVKHQLIQVATVSATDSVSGLARLTVSAVSSEPDSGTGGGDVAQDIVINGGSVQLRAERSPSGKGRVYTVSATAVDIAGNSTTAVATCKVPK